MAKSKMKYIRHLSQVLFFAITVVLIVGGVCALTTYVAGMELGIACPAGAAQVVSGLNLTMILLPTAILLATVLILGNYFCGWVCPIGSLVEGFDKVVSRVSDREGNKSSSRFLKVGVLAGALGGSFALGFPAYCPICPIGTICRSYRPAQGFMAGLELLIILPVVGVGVITRRFFCKHVCPVGGFLGLFHKFSFTKKKLPAGSECIECNNCVEKCQMDIPILNETIQKVKNDPRITSIADETGENVTSLLRNPPSEHEDEIKEVFNDLEDITSKECIMCFECDSVCPVI